MSDALADFLVDYPLYRRFRCAGGGIRWPYTIRSYCGHCSDRSVFGLPETVRERDQAGSSIASLSSYSPNILIGATDLKDNLLALRYECQGCRKDSYHFVVLWDDETVQKIGQYPPWGIDVPKDMRELLGGDKVFYQRGLICMSQSYGLGACAYFRRVVENRMDAILKAVKALLQDQKADPAAIAEIDKALGSIRADEKAAIAAKVCPACLTPGGFNPFLILHDELSKGLHKLDEDGSMEVATLIQGALDFVVTKLAQESQQTGDYMARVKTIQAKRGERGRGQ